MQKIRNQVLLLDETQAAEYFHSKCCLGDLRYMTKPANREVVQLNSVSLSDVELFKMRISGRMTMCRTRRHIVADSVRDFMLSISIDERSTVSLGGRTSVCEPGHFRLLSASVPFSTSASSESNGTSHSSLFLKLSGAALRSRIPDIDDYPDLVLPLRPGLGGLLRSLIEAGLLDGHALSNNQAEGFGKTIFDTVVDIILDTQEIDLKRARISSDSFSRVQESAKQFVLRNLSNPQLDCAMVASHCKISKSYLHAAFADEPMNVAGYIRESRLRYCRDALRNPAMRHRSIIEIASYWGFDDSNSFGRAYKMRYGITPREERLAAIRLS